MPRCLMVIILGTLTVPSFGDGPNTSARPAAPRFELKDGDRVVFLGNTLIEREQKYGHWETMLTARHPDRNITFRNLGWDGDTVWAESRGIFDPPHVGYARMLEQVKGLKPTVIFLGYGNNEAFAGQEGLPAFVKQYEKLLDDLTNVSAEGMRFLLLLPVLHEFAPAPLPDPKVINEKVRAYFLAIREIAVRRNIPALMPVRHLAETRPEWRLTSNGFHLTENGYRIASTHLSVQFSELTGDPYYASYASHMLIEGNGKVASQSAYQPFEAAEVDGGLQFQATARYLNDDDLLILFRDLKPGNYTLKIDGTTIRTATNKEWAEDIGKMAKHPDRDRYEALRRAIVAKNELYFHSWRPQNVTYLFGFRKHEQGRNAKEVAEFEKLVAEKEAEIATLKRPVPHKYELLRVNP